MDESKVQELKSKHGELVAYEVGGQTVAFRRPNRVDYSRFKKEAFKEELRHTAADNLAISCLVYPDRDAFNAIWDRFPTVVDKAANDLIELMGSEESIKKKQL